MGTWFKISPKRTHRIMSNEAKPESPHLEETEDASVKRSSMTVNVEDDTNRANENGNDSAKANESVDSQDIDDENEDDSPGEQYFLPITIDPTSEERYEFFVRRIGLDRCATGSALKMLCHAIEHELAGVHWLAEITENIPLVDLDLTVNRVSYLVEVTDVHTIERSNSLGSELVAQCKFIKILEMYDRNDYLEENPTEFHLLLKQYLRQNCCIAGIADLTPIEISEKPDELTEDASYLCQTRAIAELVDNFQFYLYQIHRPYDTTEKSESTPFGPTLRKRMTIKDQVDNRKIPVGVRQRYKRVRSKYAEKLDQIDELESDYDDIYAFLVSDNGQDENRSTVRAARQKIEALSKDIVHYHEERDMLAGLLRTWESFGLTANGPRWPKRLRVPNGRRNADRKIAHITQG